MQLTREDIDKLQQLSAVALSDKDADNFFGKVESVIAFLDQLSELDVADMAIDGDSPDTLISPVLGVEVFSDAQMLLKNVSHEIVNNSIVVKSPLA